MPLNLIFYFLFFIFYFFIYFYLFFIFCSYMHAPTSVHIAAAKPVMCNLKGFANRGLHYHKGSFTLNAFCDSD